MKLISRLLAMIILLVFAIIPLTGCITLPLPTKTGNIKEFSYQYGSYFVGNWEYRIFESNGKLWLEGNGFNGVELNIRGEVPENTLNEIMEIINEYNIKAWHGFKKYNPLIPDGYGFSLTVEYENGTLSAAGYLRYPRGYEAGHEALAAYLDKLAQNTPAYVLTEDADIQSFGINMDAGLTLGTRLSVTFWREIAEYWHGDTKNVIKFGDLPVGVTDPQELAAMAAAYYTLYPGDISDSRSAEDSSSLWLSIEDNVFGEHYIYASANADTEAFGEMLEIMLSYFGLDSSFIGSEEHSLESWRDQFSNPIFMIYDRNRFGEVIVDLPQCKYTKNGVEFQIDTEAAEAFYRVAGRQRLFSFEYSGDYGIFSEKGFGYVEWGENPMDVYNTYDKDKFIWMWGSISKGGTTLKLYGSSETYASDWDIIVEAVEALISTELNGYNS